MWSSAVLCGSTEFGPLAALGDTRVDDFLLDCAADDARGLDFLAVFADAVADVSFGAVGVLDDFGGGERLLIFFVFSPVGASREKISTVLLERDFRDTNRFTWVAAMIAIFCLSLVFCISDV